MVDQVATREKSECVKELEDGVARLVNGHDHYPVLEVGKSIDVYNVIGYRKRVIQFSTILKQINLPFQYLHDRHSCVGI